MAADPDQVGPLAQIMAFLGITGVTGGAAAKALLGQSGIRAEIDQLKIDSKEHGDAIKRIDPKLAVVLDRSREARRDRKAIMRALNVTPEDIDDDDDDDEGAMR